MDPAAWNRMTVAEQEAFELGAKAAFTWAAENVVDYDMFEDDYPVSTAGFRAWMLDAAILPRWVNLEVSE